MYVLVKTSYANRIIYRNSKKTFMKTVLFFFYSLSFKLCKYCMGKLLYKSKLEGLYHYQKHAGFITNFENRFSHAQTLLHEMKVLNIFQANLFQNHFIETNAPSLTLTNVVYISGMNWLIIIFVR